MMLVPYRLETIYTRLPYLNFALIVVNTVIFFCLASGSIATEDAESFVLRDWDLGQMIGNLFLHGGLLHLVGNMIFLWVFGNAVCATVGNVAYPFVYLLLGLFASSAHLAFDGRPALGASGAINGIVGMSLVLFPANKLRVWYTIFFKPGRFTIRAYWMIFAWFVFDIYGILTGGGNVAYWAHVGGFAAGLGIGFGLVKLNSIETYDPTIIDVIQGKPLDRTSYDLNEIAAMPLPTASKGELRLQNKTTKPARMFLVSKPPVSIPNALIADPLPVFRVTSVVQKGNDLMVFFVNEGDPVRNVSLVTSSGAPGSLQPAMQIGRREMGTMRLSNLNEQLLGGANLSISYSAGTAKTTKHLVFDELTKTFTAE
jgi:membrane associated rhomboid family serine protease